MVTIVIQNRHNLAPIPSFSFFLLCLCLLLLFITGGCSKKAKIDHEKYAEFIQVQGASEAESPAQRMIAGPVSAQPAARMIHYDGFIRLRATDPPATLQTAADRVIACGGYVERMDETSAAFRVPVARFQAVFDETLKLGDVLKKSITVQDITESFQDTGLRLQIAEATRKKLMELLNKTTKEEEKLRLLREIHRLNEEIEQLINQKDTLSALASFSRLTLEILPRQEISRDEKPDDIREFEWIQSLSPFERDVAQQDEYLAFEVPKGMVPLDRKHLWVAESADGAVFWAHRRSNYPKGDTDFWFEAIKTRIEPEFTATVSNVGNFKLLRLMSRTTAPYVYLIGVHVVDDRLEMVEIYFPSTTQETRYWESVSQSIAGGAR